MIAGVNCEVELDGQWIDDGVLLVFQQRHVLMSLGEDEAPSTGLYLKMWDLDKMQAEGSSTTGPACVRSIRVFDSKYPEAQVREVVRVFLYGCATKSCK